MIWWLVCIESSKSNFWFESKGQSQDSGVLEILNSIFLVSIYDQFCIFGMTRMLNNESLFVKDAQTQCFWSD